MRCKLKWYGHVCHSSGLAKTILQGTVKRCKKTRQTEKEVGRQRQGMDRPGVRQVPEGSGERRKMTETGCGVVCSALMTPAVKGQVKKVKNVRMTILTLYGLCHNPRRTNVT